MDLSTLSAFALAFFVFAASPGPDNVTIVARSLSHGPLSGIAYGLGTVAGILTFLFLASVGLSSLATHMGFAMTVMRYAGAAYLIWMGVKLWTATQALAEARSDMPSRSLFKVFLTGVVLNLGNPKMPLFYVALLPSVIGPSLSMTQVGLLSAVIVGVEALVIGGHVLLATRARGMLRDPRKLRRVNKTAGGTMIVAGVAVMVTR